MLDLSSIVLVRVKSRKPVGANLAIRIGQLVRFVLVTPNAGPEPHTIYS